MNKNTKTRKVSKEKTPKHDARTLPHSQQMVNKVSALVDIMDIEKVQNITQLSDRRLTRGTLSTIVNRYHVTAQTVYRWVREYQKTGGISLARKGRPQAA
jgi:DNA invertase Pin-like site-specific DNA recombinase